MDGKRSMELVYAVMMLPVYGSEQGARPLTVFKDKIHAHAMAATLRDKTPSSLEVTFAVHECPLVEYRSPADLVMFDDGEIFELVTTNRRAMALDGRIRK